MIVNVDAFRLEQALINLVTNAMKYSGTNNQIIIRAYYNDPFFVIIIKKTSVWV